MFSFCSVSTLCVQAHRVPPSDAASSMKDAALAIGAPVPMADKRWDSKVFETPTPWELGTGNPVDMSYLDCPDQLRPFIPRGQGALKG